MVFGRAGSHEKRQEAAQRERWAATKAPSKLPKRRSRQRNRPMPRLSYAAGRQVKIARAELIDAQDAAEAQQAAGKLLRDEHDKLEKAQAAGGGDYAHPPRLVSAVAAVVRTSPELRSLINAFVAEAPWCPISPSRRA